MDREREEGSSISVYYALCACVYVLLICLMVIMVLLMTGGSAHAVNL